ncbi:unnamed protein product, partial [Mesorhabditis belari]|uniref:Uncharacterized protein n=1 Tax=Mesorhabditis belari TaxID=2138241 RepID=A0AAF3FUT1_9BILA
MAAMSNTMKDNFDNLVFRFKKRIDIRTVYSARRLNVLEKIYNHVKMIREHDDDTNEEKFRRKASGDSPPRSSTV